MDIVDPTYLIFHSCLVDSHVSADHLVYSALVTYLSGVQWYGPHYVP